MYEFKIEVTRDGRWWMVHIPEIDGLTQARRLSEAETMAREYIALDRNLPYDDIKVETASIRTDEPEIREILEMARQIRNMRVHAQELEQRSTSTKPNSSRTGSPPTAYPSATSPSSSTSHPQRVSQLANA